MVLKRKNLESDIQNLVTEPDKTMKSDELGFQWSSKKEPHLSRKRAILAAHPEVKTLMGVDSFLKWQLIFVSSVQVATCYFCRDLPMYQMAFLAYIIGGTCTANLVLGLHEIAHNLAFKSSFVNRIFSMTIVNCPIGIPAAISFRRYHLEHHRYQGEDGIDADVPTEWEARTFKSVPMKILWVFMQPFFYGLRPSLVCPKTPTSMELINMAMVFAFDFIIYKTLGFTSLFYVGLSTLLGMGWHPCAYHFISEHYVWHEGYETYSYYGFINYLTHNVGYHNEHHDFPNIAGRRLPQLRAMCPEFYDTIPHYQNFWDPFLFFVTNYKWSPSRRVKRATISEDQKQKIFSEGSSTGGFIFFLTGVFVLGSFIAGAMMFD